MTNLLRNDLSRFGWLAKNAKSPGVWLSRLYASATAWASLATLVRVAGFVSVMAYALRKLPSEQIGYWYVISTIAGLAAACEFGFSQTLGRFASYFNGGAAYVPALGLEPQPRATSPNYPALAGLVTQARRLYTMLGVAVTFLMLILGTGWFMSGRGSTIPGPRNLHVAAFLIFTIGSGMNMVAFFWPHVLFGMNRVRLSNQLLVLGLLVNYSVSLMGLAAGMGVTALVLGQLLLFAVPQLLSRRHVAALIKTDRPAHAERLVSWQSLWPMTWRSGLINLTSFVSIQSTTMLCSRITDLSQTGSYGLSLQLAVLLHGFAANWITVCYPQMNELLARGEKARAASLFRMRMILVMATYAVAAVAAFFVGPFGLKLLGTKTTLLPGFQLGALFGILGWHLVVGMHADVLRAGNRAPHLPAFLCTALLTASLGWWLGRTWGISGLLAAQFLALGVLSGWWTPWRCWRELRTNMPRSPAGKVSRSGSGTTSHGQQQS